MDKYLTDLYEYIGNSSEVSIAKEIADLFNVEPKTVSKVISSIDFGDYVELSNAVKSGDKDRIEYILGVKLTPEAAMGEGANSYATSNSSNAYNTSQNQQQQTPQQGGDEKEIDATIDVTDMAKQQLDNKDLEKSQDEIQQEIARLKQLSGIEENQVSATGNVTSTTPSFLHSASITGAVISKNKQKKLTKSPSSKKPGPKTK